MGCVAVVVKEKALLIVVGSFALHPRDPLLIDRVCALVYVMRLRPAGCASTVLPTCPAPIGLALLPVAGQVEAAIDLVRGSRTGWTDLVLVTQDHSYVPIFRSITLFLPLLGIIAQHRVVRSAIADKAKPMAVLAGHGPFVSRAVGGYLL